MIQAIIFDFGGVLTRPDRRHDLIRQAERELGLAENELLYRMYGQEPWLLVSTGRISESEFRTRVETELGRPIPPALEDWHQVMFAEEMNTEVLALLPQLRLDYKLALLSNAVSSFDPWLERQIEIRSLFDVVVISGVVGLRKPDAAIYYLTAEQLGVEPPDCLFIDDKQRNTVAAESVGMQTIIFKSAEQLRAELEKRGIVMRNP